MNHERYPPSEQSSFYFSIRTASGYSIKIERFKGDAFEPKHAILAAIASLKAVYKEIDTKEPEHG